MPELNGDLSIDEVRAIALAINSRMPDPLDPCPCCHTTPSEVLPHLGRVILDPVNMTGRGFSVATTICRHCGFVRQFATQMLGVPGHPRTVPVGQADEVEANG